MRDDPEWPAWADPDRRLDIEIARDELVGGPRPTLLRGFTNGADEIAFAATKTEFSPDAEQRR